MALKTKKLSQFNFESEAAKNRQSYLRTPGPLNGPHKFINGFP